jgi:transposase
VTAPGPAQVIPAGRYAPEFGVGVAVEKYTDHLPLERQVRMMAREGLIVDSQILWISSTRSRITWSRRMTRSGAVRSRRR